MTCMISRRKESLKKNGFHGYTVKGKIPTAFYRMTANPNSGALEVCVRGRGVLTFSTHTLCSHILLSKGDMSD